MPISLALRKETGDLVRWGDHPYVKAEATVDAVRFPLLHGVDRYGDTIFNGRQMEQLLAEVQSLLAEDLSDLERASLEVLADLCNEGRRRPHRFLWFIGD